MSLKQGLSVFVCVCVYMSVFVCVCVYACLCVHVCICMRVYEVHIPFIHSNRSNPDILRSTLEGHDVIKGEGGAWAEYLRLHADPGSQVCETC